MDGLQRNTSLNEVYGGGVKLMLLLELGSWSWAAGIAVGVATGVAAGVGQLVPVVK